MSKSRSRLRGVLCGAVLAVALLPGCATINNPTDPRDPLEPINRAVYSFNDTVDHLLLKPAAEIYRGIVPPVVRTGVSNFFSNINDVLVALNNLLQGKVQYAVSDAGRVVVNTTVGVLGIFDVATKIGLEKHDEDFGQTLGYWGMGDGPYLVLPLFGPSNFRDAVGRFGDYYTDPITYVDPSRDRNILWGSRILNRRAELYGATDVLETAALDPYAFVRDGYLQRRRNLIYDGNPPRELDDEDAADKPAGKGGDKPKAEPRTQRNQQQPMTRSGSEEPVRSVLVSGEPLTPAQEAALEEAQRQATGRDAKSTARASLGATLGTVR